MIVRGWCGYCSREYSDKRWLIIEKNIITCTNPACKGKSEMVTDENDDAYFYLKRLGNGNGRK